MKLTSLCWAVCGLTVASAPAATIVGTVRAQGKPGAEADAAAGKYDSRQFKFLERVDYAGMRDFVVYIQGTVGDKPATTPEKPAQVQTERVQQDGALFKPHVLPILAGTTVEWPNNDKILHNVFSTSDANPFDLGLYKSPYTGKIPSVVFDKPGRVDVFCSIHTRMNCIVLVLENPYFAAVENGKYSITNVPPGTYKLKAWHERLPTQVKQITVPETGELKVDFVLGPTSHPKP